MPNYARDIYQNLLEWDEELKEWVPAKSYKPEWEEIRQAWAATGMTPETWQQLTAYYSNAGTTPPMPTPTDVTTVAPSESDIPPAPATEPYQPLKLGETLGPPAVQLAPGVWSDEIEPYKPLILGEQYGPPAVQLAPGVWSDQQMPAAAPAVDPLKAEVGKLLGSPTTTGTTYAQMYAASEYEGKESAEYKELEGLLSKLYPELYVMSGSMINPQITAQILRDIDQQVRDDPESFVRGLYAKGWTGDTERLLRLLGASDADIAEIFGVTSMLSNIETQQGEFMTLVNSVWSKGQFSDIGAFVDFYEARPDLAIRQIRTGDRTPEKERLLRVLGYSTEQIEEIFQYQHMHVPIDGREMWVTVGPDGRAFDANNQWVGTYNTVTRLFTQNPKESMWKDAWDAGVLAFNALGHKSKEFFLTTLPNILFGGAYDPNMEKYAVAKYGQDFVNQRKAENQRTRDTYRKLAAAANAEHEDWIVSHPELAPRPEFEVGALGNPSLISNPAYWAYEFAGTAPFTLATMGATILGTVATGNPLVGVLAGMAVATPSQVQDLRDALLAAGTPENEVDMWALFGGTLISAVEVAGDLPMLKSIAPAVFGTVRKQIEKEVAKGIAARFFAKAAKQFTIVEITETMEEIVQQAIQNAFVKIYKGDQSIFEGLTETAVKTLIATAPLAVLGAGVSPDVRAAVSQDIKSAIALAPEIGQAIRDVAEAGKPTLTPRLGITPGETPTP